MPRTTRRRYHRFAGFFNGPVRRLSGLAGFESLVAALLMLAITLTGTARVNATVQTGFRDVIITSVDAPTDMTFTPGGRLVVASQPGILYLLSSGSLIPSLDLSSVICSDFERGLLGVTFDPLFSSNHYIYIYYTYAKYGGCADNSAQSPVNRVSRFTMSGNTVNAGSETVLLDNMLSLNGNHNGGDLLFGKDGYLYVSIGDSGCELNNPSRCGGENRNARKQNYLTGKILRITRDGAIPPGNPFTSGDSGRCNVDGFTTAAKCQETYLWGLRNPFRMALDPNSSSTKIYVNDVGQDTWEEIDEAVAGSDYGWNVREGNCANGSASDCGSPPTGMRNPVFAYQHGSCNSITGGAFVPDDLWPSNFNGAYLYADYVCGQISSLKNGAATLFASNLGPITNLQFGPFGPSQALYYSLYSGDIHRIETNRDPVAVATASPLYGLTPLQVTFDGRESTDPDGDSLSYRWDFKDGSPIAAGSKLNHTFQNPGIYDVTLTVRDTQGGVDTTTVSVDAGNTPPEVDISSPTADHLFSAGESITLEGSATDAQNNLPITYAWDVRLHHDTHEHPFKSFTTQSAAFTAPAPEDLAAASNSYLVIELTATDSTGLSNTKTISLMPRTVDITVQANQPGLYLYLEGQLVSAPKTVTTWSGAPLDLEAPDQALPSGEPLVWTSWSVAGDRSFQFIAPESNTTVTANYVLAPGPSFLPVADARVHESAPNKNEGTRTGLSTSGGTASDYETVMRFDVSGISGSVQSATLYLYAYDGTENGPRIYKTSSNWSESTVTWANRPSSSGGALDDAGAIAKRTWFTLDVTAAISGNGSYNFLLRSTSSDTLSFRSRESSSGQPRLVIVTSGGGGDITAPSTPPGLQADASSSSEVDLSWSPSTDDTGVAGYELFRNGVLFAFTDQTSFTDTGRSPSKTYLYAVRAIDTAGNRSPLSGDVSIKTPAQTSTLVFTTNADGYVVADSPTKSYGARTTLRADSTPVTETYIKFSVHGLPGSVYRATLMLYVPPGSGNGTTNGPAVRLAGSTWNESFLTWNNKPAFAGSAIANVGAVGNGIWVSYDVTLAISSANTTYTFALIGESSDVVVFSSREGANPPQLVVTAFGVAAASTGDSGAIEATPAPAESTPIPTATPAAPATPTPLLPFTADFESGNLNSWSHVEGMVAVDSNVHGGTWSALAASSGLAETPGLPASATLNLGQDERDIYASTWLSLANVDPAGVQLVTFLAAGDRPLLTLSVNPDGTLVVESAKTGKRIEVGVLPLDGWHALQVHLAASGNSSSIELWVDGNLVYRGRLALNNRPIVAIRIGDNRLDRTYAIFFDDIAVDRVCAGTCAPEVSTPVATESAPEPTATNPPASTEVPTAAPTALPTENAVPSDTPTAEPDPTEPPVTDTPVATEEGETS